MNQHQFDKVKASSQQNPCWQELKLDIPRPCSGYYQDTRGFTLLHAAAQKGVFHDVKFLTEELGLYPNLKAHTGCVPADLAERSGHYRIAQYLKDAFMPLQVC